jgi:hypothetical protein
MKIKLQLKRTPDSAPEYYYTNLFVVTEWERLERRNIQQLSASTAVQRLLLLDAHNLETQRRTSW